jgi:electron transfer flavoprotein alpha subunit
VNQDIYVLVEHLRGRVADISYTLLAAARVLAAGTEGDVIAALLGEDAQELAGDLAADRVLYVDAPALAEFTPDAYQTVLAGLIQENVPRAVLLGHTSVGMDVAGALSARLELPFVSQCRRVTAEDGNLGFVSTICGGKIMATGELPGPTTLVTLIPGGFKPEEGRAEEPPEVVSVPAPPLGDLHVKLKRYIEPETGDVDISAEPILVAIGRGVQTQDNIELAEELAELLGGVICASRPVVDRQAQAVPGHGHQRRS